MGSSWGTIHKFKIEGIVHGVASANPCMEYHQWDIILKIHHDLINRPALGHQNHEDLVMHLDKTDCKLTTRNIQNMSDAPNTWMDLYR